MAASGCCAAISWRAAASIALILSRLPLLRARTRLESLVSREAAFLYNNLFLVALALTIAQPSSVAWQRPIMVRVVVVTMVEFGDGMIGLGAQGAHGAFSPKRAGTATQYITVHVDDIDAHHERALASGAEIVSRLHDHLRDYRAYEALDLEGHRWRFLQWLRAAPPATHR